MSWMSLVDTTGEKTKVGWPRLIVVLVVIAVALGVGQLLLGPTGLALACVLLAAALLVADAPVMWVLGGGLSVLALAAFLASRTVGLPEIRDDVGNWTEPLGYPTVASEVLCAAVAALVLERARSTRREAPGEA